MRATARTNGGRGNSSGFTMVELMVVLAVIAILAAVLSPSVSRYMERAQAQEASREVTNTLRMARNHAMSRGEIILAEVTTGEGRGDDENGGIELYRTDTSDNEEFDCTGDDPNDTECFALSCAQATALDRSRDLESIHELDLGETAPDMFIAGIEPEPDGDGDGAISEMMCFSPSGRVLASGGLSLGGAGDGDCDYVGVDLWVRKQLAEKDSSSPDPTSMRNPVDGGPALDECVDDEERYEQQRQGRQMVNMWQVTVPYNGAVTMNQ